MKISLLKPNRPHKKFTPYKKGMLSGLQYGISIQRSF